MANNHHPREAERVAGLEETAELFQLLVDQVKDYAIFALDTTGRIASWNDGAELLKGYRHDEIVGRHIETFYTDEDRKVGKPSMLLDKARRDGRAEDESWRVRKDGSRFWANVVITALYDTSTGIHRGFAKVTRDLTTRMHAEESLRAARESLEKRVQERTTELQQALSDIRDRNEQLEQFADAVVGRELKMMELEREITRLRKLLPGQE